MSTRIRQCNIWTGEKECGALVTGSSSFICSAHMLKYRKARWADKQSAPDGMRAYTRRESWFAAVYGGFARAGTRSHIHGLTMQALNPWILPA